MEPVGEPEHTSYQAFMVLAFHDRARLLLLNDIGLLVTGRIMLLADLYNLVTSLTTRHMVSINVYQFHTEFVGPILNTVMHRSPVSSVYRKKLKERLFRAWSYPMVRVFAARLNCFPMYAEKTDDAALTLPI